VSKERKKEKMDGEGEMLYTCIGTVFADTDISFFFQVDVIKDLAILSLVGKQMKNMVGIAGMMFSTLASAGVNIEMISQGSSEINISCVIDEKSSIVAMNAIHDQLLSKRSKLILPAARLALE
jgi:aspartate kinase